MKTLLLFIVCSFFFLSLNASPKSNRRMLERARHHWNPGNVSRNLDVANTFHSKPLFNKVMAKKKRR